MIGNLPGYLSFVTNLEQIIDPNQFHQKKEVLLVTNVGVALWIQLEGKDGNHVSEKPSPDVVLHAHLEVLDRQLLVLGSELLEKADAKVGEEEHLQARDGLLDEVITGPVVPEGGDERVEPHCGADGRYLECHPDGVEPAILTDQEVTDRAIVLVFEALLDQTGHERLYLLAFFPDMLFQFAW
jgi:hypothetical protein